MTTQMTSSGGQLVAPIDDTDHVLGPSTAPVTLIEYGDYQCPYCAAAHPVVGDLLRERADTIRFAYRHFPVTNIHPFAEDAAQAAEAAGAQQCFWPVHDWLFTHQDQLDPASLPEGLNGLGLNGETIMEEVSGHRYLGKVRSDFVGGMRSGVNATPTFFINGMRHDRGYSLPEMLMAVDEAASDFVE